MKKTINILITLVLVIFILCAAVFIWNKYMYTPWTRDARVRADVVNIAPDVSGWLTELNAHNTSQVSKGQVLFTVDKARYQVAYDQAVAQEAQAKVAWQRAQNISDRRAHLQTAVSKEDIDNSRLDAASALATYQETQAETQSALIDLQRTTYLSPADGTITNLDVSNGDYVNKGVTKLALTVKGSYYLTGYFEETKLPGIHIGDSVDIWILPDTLRQSMQVFPTATLLREIRCYRMLKQGTAGFV
jgi:RND family efflux transporter MFP subunit